MASGRLTPPGMLAEGGPALSNQITTTTSVELEGASGRFLRRPRGDEGACVLRFVIPTRTLTTIKALQVRLQDFTTHPQQQTH